MNKKILIALTNTPTYGEKNDATGLWLGEATEFVDEVSKRGFTVDFVSPKGGYVPLDPRSMKRMYVDDASFELYRSADFQERALAHSLRPDEVDAGEYAALYYTGGHGVMWDFPSSEGLAHLCLQIYDNGGYLTSVCHGIAGLLFVKDRGEYLVMGKNITGFTTTEEYLSGHSADIPFWNEKVAQEHGAVFHKKRPFGSYALQDGRIITGQNPESPRAVARLLLKNLDPA
ncbi:MULTISPECIES: type 1 glutamine amidotransferase domain-containing protein [Gordonibacter]|uniref:Type 1 glutamine amidotransferase domain-containing protein n=1 Tax=Gordonibacter faecis TaxID=3047475 RepID=A0ABT7DS54_9ACTN|nr:MULTISPECIES: type 1 glutamine amidotransferase domain-containing protein [unclassified Gordonibacter]MDJ1651361.1 type 1 glutamine amidotransferase domain-containing protein [Gordonibacter sp. KGMB12511]HIW75354.1 type 1 glutamine amidotransferase domain-containing protein [Candidatus Gordonibacter avicola]